MEKIISVENKAENLITPESVSGAIRARYSTLEHMHIVVKNYKFNKENSFGINSYDPKTLDGAVEATLERLSQEIEHGTHNSYESTQTAFAVGMNYMMLIANIYTGETTYVDKNTGKILPEPRLTKETEWDDYQIDS